MHIRLQSDGGFGYFPGLDKPVIVDTADLPPDDAAGLESLVVAADFFGRPEQMGAPLPGAADQRRYTITIEDDDRSHTVEVTEPVEDSALQALIESLRGVGRSARDD